MHTFLLDLEEDLVRRALAKRFLQCQYQGRRTRQSYVGKNNAAANQSAMRDGDFGRENGRGDLTFDGCIGFRLAVDTSPSSNLAVHTWMISLMLCVVTIND